VQEAYHASAPVFSPAARRRAATPDLKWENGCEVGSDRLTSRSAVPGSAAPYHDPATPCSASAPWNVAFPQSSAWH